jgi:hypothetical protein
MPWSVLEACYQNQRVSWVCEEETFEHQRLISAVLEGERYRPFVGRRPRS